MGERQGPNGGWEDGGGARWMDGEAAIMASGRERDRAWMQPSTQSEMRGARVFAAFYTY